MAFKRIIEITGGPEGGNGVTISENYMSFEITRDRSGTPNKAEVKIYNLSDASISTIAKAKNKLIIKAGYVDEGGAKALFYGDVYTFVVTKESTERILTIEAYDGLKNIQSKFVSLSYASGITAGKIIQDLINVLAYPLNGTLPNIQNAYNNGFAFVGSACDALTKVLARIGLRWSIQNEQLTIYQNGMESIPQQLVLGYDTGLMFVQKRDRDNTVDPITPEHRKPGAYYKLTTLLFPQLLPGALVQINTPNLQGGMVIESCKMIGDNFGGKFQIEAEAQAV